MIYRDPGIPAVIPRAGEIIDFGPWAKAYAKSSIVYRIFPHLIMSFNKRNCAAAVYDRIPN
jgi:hypothetical protein